MSATYRFFWGAFVILCPSCQVFMNIKIGDDEAEKVETYKQEMHTFCSRVGRASWKVGIELFAKSYPKTAELLASKPVISLLVLLHCHPLGIFVHFALERRALASPERLWPSKASGTWVEHAWNMSESRVSPQRQRHMGCQCAQFGPGSTFHRIIPGFMCQGGVPWLKKQWSKLQKTHQSTTRISLTHIFQDFTRGNGTGGELAPRNGWMVNHAAFQTTVFLFNKRTCQGQSMAKSLRMNGPMVTSRRPAALRLTVTLPNCTGPGTTKLGCSLWPMLARLTPDVNRYKLYTINIIIYYI